MFFVVKVNRFNGSANRPAVADKNGMEPIILTSYNGILPNNAKVLSGTVAANNGMQVGKNYMVTLTRTGTDFQYGDQYRYDVVGELSPVEIAQNIQTLGKGVIQSEVVATTASTASKVPVNAGIDEDEDDN
jgi:hypothetical protein